MVERSAKRTWTSKGQQRVVCAPRCVPDAAESGLGVAGEVWRDKKMIRSDFRRASDNFVGKRNSSSSSNSSIRHPGHTEGQSPRLLKALDTSLQGIYPVLIPRSRQSSSSDIYTSMSPMPAQLPLAIRSSCPTKKTQQGSAKAWRHLSSTSGRPQRNSRCLHLKCCSYSYWQGLIPESIQIDVSSQLPSQLEGRLKNVSAVQLGASVIRAAVDKSNVPFSKIMSTYIGNVLSASLGQAPARQATINSGLLLTTKAMVINQACSSGLKAVVLAAQSIALGLEEAVVAGGMESVSRVPYYFPHGGQLPYFGTVEAYDGLVRDGHWDSFKHVPVAKGVEETAKKHGISRAQQDEHAIRTFQRAQAASTGGRFKDEIAEVWWLGKREDTISEDEFFNTPQDLWIHGVKPNFDRVNGTITPRNMTSFNDGASALVLGSKATATAHGSGSRVLAKLISSADVAVSPSDFAMAPAKAIPMALEQAGISTNDVSVWEINEAYAAVVVLTEKVSIELQKCRRMSACRNMVQLTRISHLPKTHSSSCTFHVLGALMSRLGELRSTREAIVVQVPKEEDLDLVS